MQAEGVGVSFPASVLLALTLMGILPALLKAWSIGCVGRLPREPAAGESSGLRRVPPIQAWMIHAWCHACFRVVPCLAPSGCHVVPLYIACHGEAAFPGAGCAVCRGFFHRSGHMSGKIGGTFEISSTKTNNKKERPSLSSLIHCPHVSQETSLQITRDPLCLLSFLSSLFLRYIPANLASDSNTPEGPGFSLPGGQDPITQWHQACVAHA